MCGIAGIVQWDGRSAERSEIEHMTQAISHRGPDGEGIFLRNGVALGHRRLSIIDLEGGKQPMCNEDGQIWITYNGEIYNYLDLRAVLEQKGHRFATRSDTEVIVHAYEEWGPECVKRFRGMFAFGIADFQNKRLLLARDHFGIKPLYYRQGKGYLAFASEITALRDVQGDLPKGDLQSVDLYLRFQYIPAPHTIYKGIFKLLPAHYLVVDFNGHIGDPVAYWDFQFEPDDGLSDSDWLDRVDSALSESVEAHLIADVPFGVYLSGGIDSTLVAMKMSEILKHPVSAFSIGFEEKDFSELEYAKEAAKKLGLELYTEIVREDILEVLPELVRHYGEPFGDSSSIPTWCVSRLARRHVPFVLSGDGGDETFAGYQSYARWMEKGSFRYVCKIFPKAPKLAISTGLNLLKESIERRYIYDLREWQKCIFYMDDRSRNALWLPEYRYLASQECELFQEASKSAQDFDRLAYAQYLDYKTYLPCDILTKVDVASMYHGLEVRTPIIDLNMIGLASHLPLAQRFRKDVTGNLNSKYLLKRILEKIFPFEFVHRKKQGFAIPRKIWFLPGHLGRKMIERVLSSQGSKFGKWFDMDVLRSYIFTHTTDRDNSDVLWLLLVLGLWLEQNPNIEFE